MIKGTLARTTITRNGQEVDCFGKWEEDSNAHCVFENECFDGVYADGAKNWKEAVEKVTAYAKRRGTVLLEMSAV
jgi:hypothetical protein